MVGTGVRCLWCGLDGTVADISPVRLCHDSTLFMSCDMQPLASEQLEHMLKTFMSGELEEARPRDGKMYGRTNIKC